MSWVWCCRWPTPPPCDTERMVRAAMLALLLAVAPTAAVARGWPSTRDGVHVFDDQLPGNLSPALNRFAARHYDGTQKVPSSAADRLHAVNPRFLVLHYRLGEALGYKTSIVDGDRWVREWPKHTQAAWFFRSHGQRVYNTTWGWSLTDIGAPSWRTWWEAQVRGQVRRNHDDGVFMDSLSVPNELGPDSFTPRLPDLDLAFERAWSRRIERWLAWLQRQPLGRRYLLVPNVGSWITTRDQTSSAAADGVMVEGFATGGDDAPYALADWQLQADRILGLVRRGRAVVGQSYVHTPQARLFALGTYLLEKGDRSYLNLETASAPEWWPEYGVPIGHPSSAPPRTIAALRHGGVYARAYSNGRVLVNPGTAARTVALGRALWLVAPQGGGEVPASGRAPGRLVTRRVSLVRL